ncbi:MAG: phosphoenolpyruvate carboxylase [Candidatus Dormibacteraeota bacterium]|nr:phosphoenolpyruvate carboxylase [Candidatus Dormibacteraeota bacterium]
MPRRALAKELDDLSAPLRADVRRLSSALGELIAESDGPGLLDAVERLRKAAIDLRQSRGAAAEERLKDLIELVDSFDLDQAESVVRAFTVYFQLANLAEERHRVRILRQRARSDAEVPESLTATVGQLRREVGDAALGELLAQLEIRLILTAHPTEARRRAVVDALRRIAEVMDLFDQRLSASQEAEAERRLREQLTILWRTRQLRSRRPTPLDEVRSVLSVFDESLFPLVPMLYRELELALQQTQLHSARPIDAARIRPFLRWGSWVGGDRDGNPHVDHGVTEAALEVQADRVLLKLESAARRVAGCLTLSEESTPPSAELRRWLHRTQAALSRADGVRRAHSSGQPHRDALLLSAERLLSTRLDRRGSYDSAGEFLADLGTIQRSLLAAGADRVAGGELQNLVWQAETFGFHLASLEVRQHSSIHREAIAELLPGAEDDAAALDAVADGGRRLPAKARSVAARETLATFRVIARLQARYGTDSCTRYVVSFTRSPADVVAVAALARMAVPGDRLALEVVPLFESRADLEAAPGVLDGLLDLPGWRRRLEQRGRRLEVMLGYSDASKDAGFLAANVALYRAQSTLVAWARRNHIDLTLFHGRGGAVGRGGGPAGRAIRSQAPGSLQGRFKVTEQGEVIFARYGNRAIALRHLEQVSSAVLTASTARHREALAAAEERFFDAAELMARTSEAVYRQLVEAPDFAEFFARVTPLDEIGQLAIGSRPARRGGVQVRDLGQLRAIPWVFAWTQNRCNLPGWYGLGSGLQAIVSRSGLPYLRRMVAEWPFLNSVIDNAEMSLAKADPMIAGLYLARGGRPELVDLIRAEYRLTRRLVLAVTGNKRLLAGHPILQLAVDLRNPYVDALSFLQLRFLRELQEADGARSAQLSAFVRLTVSGVAAGLQNTG